MKKSIFSILCCLLSVCTTAQRNFKPGYVISKDRDTIRGSVNFKAWYYNPVSIDFKTGNTEIQYSPREILGFGIDAEQDYVSKVVTYQLSTFDAYKARNGFADEVRTDTVFLRRITSGRYNLYEYMTRQRPYYFSGRSDQYLHELVYRTRVDATKIIEDTRYKDTILAYATLENQRIDLFQRITKATYNAKELNDLFTKINGSSNIDHIATEKKRKVNTVEIGGGMISNLYSFESAISPSMATRLLSTARFDNSISPLFTVAMVLGSQQQFNRMQMGFQLEYATDKYYGSAERASGTERKEVYKSNIHALKLSAAFRYIFNPLAEAKIFIAPYAGIAKVVGSVFGTTIRSFDSGAESTYNDYPDFNYSYALYGAGIGILMKKSKVELRCNYTSPMHQDKAAATEIRAIQVSLGYSFAITRF